MKSHPNFPSVAETLQWNKAVRPDEIKRRNDQIMTTQNCCTSVSVSTVSQTEPRMPQAVTSAGPSFATKIVKTSHYTNMSKHDYVSSTSETIKFHKRRMTYLSVLKELTESERNRRLENGGNSSCVLLSKQMI
jgi:hypothetical protein